MKFTCDEERIIDAIKVHARAGGVLHLCPECPLRDSEEEDEDGNYEGECTYLISQGALDIINRLTLRINELENQWIPVEDHLPKESGYYIIATVRNYIGDNGRKWSERVSTEAWFDVDEGVFTQHTPTILDASHWMERPKLPEKVCENNVNITN